MAPPKKTKNKSIQPILDAMVEGVLILSKSGRVKLINHEACRILEARPDTDSEQTLASLIPANHPLLNAFENVVRTQRARVEGEVVLERRSGPEFVLDLTLSPIYKDELEEPDVLLVLRDRTTFREMSEDASQKKKLSSYGHIAAGIAHEVKNPLGGIRGAAELLQKRVSDERSKRTSLLIIQEVDRISSLVDELMVFAKDEALSIESVNLHRLLNRMMELICTEPLASNVEFECVFDPSIPEIAGDPSRLTQVFLNLARNAIQAMGETGGRLTLRTGMSLQNRLTGADGKAVPTVNIFFEDQGPGIEESVLERLATPFFTTKAEGTGLGLAVSQHWVSRHRGRLIIDGHGPTGGASVCIKLPLKSNPIQKTLEK